MAIFDQTPSLRAGKRARRFGFFILILIIVIFILLTSVSPYCEYLWFMEDGRQPVVFARLYATRGILFAVFFAISLALIYLNVARALRISMVYLEKPGTVGEVVVSRILGVVQDHGPTITKVGSLLLALLLSTGFSTEWNSFLLATHAQSFHKLDPIFGMDLGFFVFKLPWQIALVGFFLGLFVLISLLTAGLYIGLQAIAAIGRIELGRSTVRSHLSLVFGITIILFGAQLWLKRYQYGLLDSGQFVGAGYAAMQQLQVQGPLAILIMIGGLVMALAGLWKQGWRVSGFVLAGCALIYVLGLMIYPALVQVWKVNPDKLNKESPYAANAINLTRFAYALDHIEVKDTTVQDSPSAADLKDAAETLDNMRLWDPSVLQQSIEALQGLKRYYRFRDVDLDRYTIGGKRQMVMVSPRDIDVSGLDPSFQTWVNMRLQYTHGFGITMSPVNTSDPSGQPLFIVHDIPPVSPPDLKVSQPRIYYSDFRTDAGDPMDNYVLVDTKQAEFDYPSEEGDKTDHWNGNRGINVGSFFPKLAFSISLGDINLLISGNVTSNTRLLMHRGILERARMLYPFLTFDQDPYIVLFQGRLLWILDGYTSTDEVPYSAHVSMPDGSVNYLRNPVKVVIDAYSGECNGYEIDPDEPILKAYESIYPNLIKSRSEIPAGLEKHFRYPEDLFHAQAIELTQYHVTEPIPFLNNEDAWDLPTERGIQGGEEAMQPYYVQMRLPEDPTDEFMLILPFTPRLKGNMSGWLAAHCDPESYGKLRLYEYPRGSILPGPKQMEANFNQNSSIANLNTLLKNAQSEVIVGNLLVIPIGNSVMYAEPMFLRSVSPGITAIPELKKVVLAVKDTVVVADTYAEALKQLFGTAEAPSTPAQTQQTPQTQTPLAPAAVGNVPKAQIQSLLQLANQADAALRAGDFAKYGAFQKQLKAKLEALSK